MDFENLSNDEEFHSSFSTANSVNATLSRPSPFNKIDPDVVNIMSSLNATLTSPSHLGSNNLRLYNSSSYANSEAESDRLSNPFSGLNKDSLSVISAPYLNRGVIKHNLFGSASIAGHVITQASPFDNNQRQQQQKKSNFLEKFGSVADRTRDLENGLSLFNIDETPISNERRTSILTADQQPPTFNNGTSSSPTSLHETLNGVSSRHQSVSDRIDSYQQEQERRISFSSEVIASDNGSNSADQQQQIKHNIWNPASAHTFQPATNQFMPSQQPMFFGGANPAGPMFPNMYSPFPYLQQPLPPNVQHSPSQQLQLSPYLTSFPPPPPLQAQQLSKSPSNDKEDSQSSKFSGVNLLNRSMSPPAFMMQPFIPYGMFPPVPFAGTPPPLPQHGQQEEMNKTPVNIATAPGFNHSGVQHAKESPSSLNKGNGKKSPHGNKSNSQQSSKSARSRNGPPYIQRSPLLEEFRANASDKEYRLSDIYGHGVEFSKDQHGSRFIQAQLSRSSEEEKEVIFNEIRDVAFELMSDVFGNYVIQKYFEFGNNVQRKVLLDTMESHIRDLSLQMYGCRVIQRAVEHIEPDQKLKLVTELDDANIILECCKDANGNHVIQKAIELIPSSDVGFIFNSIKDQVYHLSTNSFGCRVVQKLLEFGEVQQCEFIVSVLEKYVDVLLVDKFGNYVIQYILTNESNCNTENIINIVNETIMNDFTKLSTNKFSSNVVESFITTTPLTNRLEIKKQTMEDNNNKLIRLINDPYGNYVVQKLVTVDINSKDEVTKQFVESIRDYLDDSGNTNSKLSIEKLKNIIRSI